MKKPKCPPPQKRLKEIIKGKNNQSLFDYMTNKEINSFVKEMNNRYLHWDEFIYRTPPNNADKELVWLLIKFNRDATAKKIKINEESEFILKFNLLDSMQQKLHEFDMNLGGTLGSSQFIPQEEKNRYLINSIMEEAIASSQLEGASTTRRIAKEMLRTARKPKNKSEKMIMNNYLTAKMIKDSDVKKLTPQFMLEIHKNITKGTLDDKNYEGKFRDSDDVVVVDGATGEISHNPPRHELIDKLIEDVCEFANKPSNYFMHPIIKASILHFLVGYIHPFVDGNGRTARSIFYWYLIKEGYWIIEFMSISRIIIKSPSQYSRAYIYTETDENDLTYFLNYQIKTMDIALRELKSYISRKMKEKETLFRIIDKIEGINMRQANVIKILYQDEKKRLTIKELQETFNIVYETARKDLLDLEKREFIERRLLGKQKFIFVRSNKFHSLISRYIDKIE